MERVESTSESKFYLEWRHVNKVKVPTSGCESAEDEDHHDIMGTVDEETECVWAAKHVAVAEKVGAAHTKAVMDLGSEWALPLDE